VPDLELAYQKLASLDPEDALLAIMAMEEQRKEQHFAKYWSSDPSDECREFYNRIEEDFAKLTKDIKIYGLLGGNRSSKTERGAFLAVAWLMGKEYFQDEPSWKFVKDLPIPEHGVNIWIVGLDFSVIRDVLWNEKLRRGHRHPGLLPQTPSPLITRISDSEFQVQVNVNGRKSSLTCKSADSGREKMQSASVDLVIIDEEPESEIFDELYQRTVDCGGKIILTLTPLNDIGSGIRKPWVYDLYKEFKAGRQDVIFLQLSALDNPFIPEEEKIKLKEKWLGHPEERARLYGEFIQRSGMVYPMWDNTKHLIKPFNIPYEWRRIASIDPAATGVTACIWAAISPRNDVYFYREYYNSNLIVSEHAKNILARNGGDKIDTWLIDPFWASARNAESHKQGSQLFREAGIPVRLANREADFALNVMREYLNASLDSSARHPKLFIFNTLQAFRTEIEGYVWDFYGKGNNKGQSKDKPLKRADHLMNSSQYLLALRPKAKSNSFNIVRNPNNSYT